MAAGCLRLSVRVSPGSSSPGVSASEDGVYRIRLRSRPVEDKANRELVALLASEFSVPRSAVRILAGGHGRSKVVEISEPARIPPWMRRDPR